jgi:hypothetical protein
MAYDVSSYEPGDGHQMFDAEGPAAETTPAAPAAVQPVGSPRRAAAPAPAAPAAPAAAPAAKEEEKPVAAAEEPVAEEVAEAPKETPAPYELKVPEWIDMREITAERQGHLTAFQTMAPEVGIDAAAAQGIIDVAVDAATQLDYQSDPDATGDDAQEAMTRVFGEATAKNLIGLAQQYAHARGESFKKFLDTTGLGNDVSTLVALAFARSGYLTQSVTEAKAEIAKIMQSEAYQQSNKLALLRLQVLSRIAHKDTGPDAQLASAARVAAAKPAAPAPAASAATGDPRADLAKLMGKGSALYDAGHPEHAAAVKRFHELAGRV